ncbi:MAG: type I-B CRISPR-associated protein Cas8b/Csh1, partial [Bacteroidota bacterium]|nr:type I-B CRISPR-associated protein Cas8b/Csh1 [Candidatus Kapabacteria bacterium]MDW8221243.1 type I-B CRISPR-associated protein Cas8b/Csh1 [Bacteroidota bacterium]
AFVERTLRFRFCGYDYFLLPTPTLNIPNEEFPAIASDFPKFALTDEAKQQSNYAELDIIEALAAQQNTATYTLFFFEKNKAEFKILASIDDVFPSYMRRVYDARESIAQIQVFHDLPGKDKTTYNLRFDFRLIQYFFNRTKEEGDNTYHFLNIVRAVFMQKHISYGFLLRAILRRTRTSARNDANFNLDTLKGYMVLCFLAKLHLLHPFSLQAMSKEIPVDAPIEAFFREHEKFFDYGSPVKRAVFLEGVLTQKLLNIQYRERGSQPFFTRLNGLNINRKIFERLLPEIRAKLIEYDKFFPHYQRLSEAIAAYTVASEPHAWKLSDDEYSFYFALGMSLAKHLYPKEESSTEEQQP